jgi:uncharacterized protein (DUF111 family)
MFEISTTIGFREIPTKRLSLKREEGFIKTSFGEVREKTVFLGNGKTRSKTEYEDCARIAREQSVSLEEAEELIRKEVSQK